VTHNAAILGILGVGKSMLAIELVERMLTVGIKVICLDLTNQYAKELSDFYDSAYEKGCLDKIRKAGDADRGKCADNPEEGGSLPALTRAIFEDLQEFLKPENPRKLKIYNPSQLTATKQLGEPKQYKVGDQWHRGAPLWTVTPVEITRIVSEAALVLLQDRLSETARACLIYEEAHSLVPEWTAVASEGDRAATNATARAILQGRKYGLGCLLVTQRTASVTKTILNQCNTVFAMRTFDETGKEFLANYVGKDYASSLSSLPERHAVFFGKASTCENPVLIQLNDREKFKTSFRKQFPPPALPIDNGPAIEAAKGDFDDEIPF
jgi:DNA helicase HerA-like ATPase